jgi:Lar family restriction alleviation protein
MSVLKPCPFCGGKARWRYRKPIGWVMCKKCGASSATLSDNYEEADCQQEAIAAWNRRADAVPVVRGKWKLYGNDDDSGMSYWCTVCNFQLSEDLFYSGYKNGRWIENGVFKYCPNCGAKMEVEP